MGVENMAPRMTSAKAAHVNMMTDTIIANLPPDALRSIVRGLLGVDPKVTPTFHELTSRYFASTEPLSTAILFSQKDNRLEVLPAFEAFRSRYRCLMACGQGFDTLQALADLLAEAVRVSSSLLSAEVKSLDDMLSKVDSDVVQATTAVQKQLATLAGERSITDVESRIIKKIMDSLIGAKLHFGNVSGQHFPLERGYSTLQMLQNRCARDPVTSNNQALTKPFKSSKSTLETVHIGELLVPRIFMGLWQFSSPAWGTASRSKIDADFRKHVDSGFIAYDMADHYGDAEVTFGQFRSSQADSSHIYCATKWCVFEPISVSPEVVDSAITGRLLSINAQSIELLQFHWQNYKDEQYVQAAKLIEQDDRVTSLGLCNFDTLHMEEIVESGVKVVSNQVQFSLIDLRPTFKMAASCVKHNIILLTYGSLCGGLLADKWLDVPAPNMFEENMTPSHRKYLEMIMVWGGWTLFQELLCILATIGQKYEVSLSIVAMRWVLDHEYVGAIIIGARMGISEHVDENLRVFSFKLDADDQADIQKILDRCQAREMFEAMRDCGSEYR